MIPGYLAGALRDRTGTRADAAVRDIPSSCLCLWRYLTGPARWVRVKRDAGCTWHLTRRLSPDLLLAALMAGGKDSPR